MGTILLSKMSLNVITVELFWKNLCSGTHCGGFQFLLIIDLWGISFHAAIVFGLGKNLFFKSVLGHCTLMWLNRRKLKNRQQKKFLGWPESKNCSG